MRSPARGESLSVWLQPALQILSHQSLCAGCTGGGGLDHRVNIPDTRRSLNHASQASWSTLSRRGLLTWRPPCQNGVWVCISAWHLGHWCWIVLRRLMQKGIKQQPATHLGGGKRMQRCHGSQQLVCLKHLLPLHSQWYQLHSECSLFDPCGPKETHPERTHRKQTSHLPSPTLLLVSVRTTSSQDGHLVTAAVWLRRPTFSKRERRRRSV